MQSLAPASSVFPLTASPFREETVKVPHLFPAALFVVTESGFCPVECFRSFPANIGAGVFSRGIELRLCLPEIGLALLSSFPEYADESAESLVDLSTFLVHIAVECLSPDHPAEITQRKNILEENTDLFADVVIKLPHDVRIADGYFHRHVGDTPGLFRRQPRSLGNLGANPLDHILIHLDVMLEAVQRVLQLIHQFVGVVVPPRCDAVADQVGDSADLIATSLHGNVCKVPPGRLDFGLLVLLLLIPLAHFKTALDKK